MSADETDQWLCYQFADDEHDAAGQIEGMCRYLKTLEFAYQVGRRAGYTAIHVWPQGKAAALVLIALATDKLPTYKADGLS